MSSEKEKNPLRSGTPSQEPQFEFFVIHDTKAGSYRDPMQSINRWTMVREIESYFRDPRQASNQLVTNSEDFALYKVAEYSRATGVIVAKPHEHIANLTDIRSQVQRTPRPAPAPSRQTSFPQEGDSGH